MLELAEKIDTPEALNTYIRRVYGNSEWAYFLRSEPMAWNSMCSEAWWHAREYVRRNYDSAYGYNDRALPSRVSQACQAAQLMLPAFSYMEVAPDAGFDKVSFFVNHADGLRDRRTVTTFGRYLKQFNPHAPDAALQKACDAWRVAMTPPDVKFTQDADLIERIYLEMNTGCMRYTKEQFESHPQVHPTAVYANCPGVRLAYLEPDPGKFTARCFVFEASETDKRMIRGFGDDGPLLGALEKQGFTYGSWEGAKLHAIPHDNVGGQFVMPYLDGDVQQFDVVDDEWLLCTEGGSYMADSSDGKSYDTEEDHDDQVELCSDFYGSNEWVDEDDATYCDRYDGYICRDDRVALYEGGYAHADDENLSYLSTDYYSGHMATFRDVTCDGDGEVILDTDRWYDAQRNCYWHDDVDSVELANGNTTRAVDGHTFELHFAARHIDIACLGKFDIWLELDTEDDLTAAPAAPNSLFARQLAIKFAGVPTDELYEWVDGQFDDLTSEAAEAITAHFKALIDSVITALPQTAEVIGDNATIEEEEEVTA